MKSLKLSKIEIEDIKVSEKEFASGKAPVFDSVEELFSYIDNEANKNGH